MSLYCPDSPYIVYCSPCWWADSWDAGEYARDYDFSKPFFQQFHDLMIAVPKQATYITKSVDCKYSDAVTNCKNCYLNFGSYIAEDCLYCNTAIMSKSCVDSDLGINMDHAYETYNSDAVYNTKFVWFSEECMDSSFLFDCRGCSNCFGCVNLRNKKYHIFNKPYSKKEYFEQMKYWDMGDYKKVLEAKIRFQDLYSLIPRRFARITNAVHVTGDNIKNTKNCQTCFATTNGVENCKYIFLGGLNLKDSYDVGFMGESSELLYEGMSGLHVHRSSFFKGASESLDIEYCDQARSTRKLFGCAGIQDKKFCILNRQYSEKGYDVMVEKIKKHMDEMPYIDESGHEYKYGEYFPSKLSPWAYNESTAYQWFPLKKEEALARGYSWEDREKRDYKTTVRASDLPDHIKDVPDSIVEEVIVCRHSEKLAHSAGCEDLCTTAFKIIPEELQFYRAMNIALPRACFNCRYYERISLRNPPKLWHRQCQCSGAQSSNNIYQNTAMHAHGDQPCSTKFETAFSPDRKEIIYCGRCYQGEFI